MQQQSKPRNRNKLNLLIDIIIFVAFLVVMAPHFSGIAVHEWLSIAFGAALIAHLLLHWQWLVEVTRRFFRKMSREARINYVLNWLLFIAMTIAIFSGFMISESALPLFSVQVSQHFVWRGVHETSANASLALIGLHIAMHWQWIVNAIKRYVLQPLGLRRPSPSVAAESLTRSTAHEV